MFPQYRDADVHRLICRELDQFLRDVEDGKSPRLAISMPPRCGKSELASTQFPAYVLGKHPDWFIIHTSYTADLSHDFSRKVREMVGSEKFAGVFPGVEPARNSRSAKRWGIHNRRGYFVSAGVGGPLTGRGAHVAIIDDPVKNNEDADSEIFRAKQRNWYDSTLSTRLQKGGGVLLILTRWHEADLAGYVINGIGADRERSEKWKVISLPALAEAGDALGREIGTALWPEEFPVDTLKAIRDNMAPRWWESLYQQRPTAAEGNLIKCDKIRPLPVGFSSEGMKIYQAWDLAISEKKTADYTVCTTIAVDSEQNVYILDVERKRTPFRETLRRIGIQGSKWPVTQIGIETGGFQAAAFQASVSEFMLPFKELKPDKDKVTRAQLLADRVDMGKVYADRKAPWWADFQEEVRQFPGEHDDQVDATVYALMMARVNPLFFAISKPFSFLRQQEQQPQKATDASLEDDPFEDESDDVDDRRESRYEPKTREGFDEQSRIIPPPVKPKPSRRFRYVGD